MVSCFANKHPYLYILFIIKSFARIKMMNDTKKKCKTFLCDTYKGKTFNNVIIYHLCDM